MEDIPKCKKHGRRELAWTSAKNGSGQHGRGHEGVLAVTGCAGVGFWAIRAGGFLPVEAAGNYKTVAGAYFRGRGACTQYDPKVILGANTLDPKGDAYSGSKES